MNERVNVPLITRREFCQQGKFGPKTLQRIEARGDGPPAIEITPGFVRYRQSAIDAWFAARTRTGARAAGKTPIAAIAARHRRGGVMGDYHKDTWRVREGLKRAFKELRRRG